MKAHTYLGDSVYVELEENRMVKLTTNNGLGPTNTIFLDMDVLDALLTWLNTYDKLTWLRANELLTRHKSDQRPNARPRSVPEGEEDDD
jgi:hypothetical protein